MNYARRGSKGDLVEDIQTALNKALGLNIRVDGDFGPMTENLVTIWQGNIGVDVTGVISSDNLIALGLGANVTPTRSDSDYINEPFTVGLLTAATGKYRANGFKQILPWLNKFALRFGVNDPYEIARMLAHLSVESGIKYNRAENLSYTARRMQVVFGRNKHPARIKLYTHPENYARRPVALANYVYGNRKSLGNRGESSGDGWNFRGKGLIQTTGRENHMEVTRIYNEYFPEDPQDFVENPDKLLEAKYSVASVFCWWLDNNMTNFIKSLNGDESLEAMRRGTKKVNGGTHGLADRYIAFKRIRKYQKQL